MPNVNDLRRYLKADMVQSGDQIYFCDAGQILNKEFEDKQTKVKKTQDVLEMEVTINGSMKRVIYSPNSTSLGVLKAAWGQDTENWVGKTGIVSIVEQISFGKLTNVLVVKPYQAQVSQAAQALPPRPVTPKTPEEIAAGW